MILTPTAVAEVDIVDADHRFTRSDRPSLRGQQNIFNLTYGDVFTGAMYVPNVALKQLDSIRRKCLTTESSKFLQSARIQGIDMNFCFRNFFLSVCVLAIISAQGLSTHAAEPPGRSFPLPFTSNLPYDVTASNVGGLDTTKQLLTLQRDFDILAWQAFVALNWWADGKGAPLPGAVPGGNKPDPASNPVWAFWRPASSIFRPDGQEPEPSDSQGPQPLALSKPLFENKAAWKGTATNADENLQAFSGPLVDQNGKWVRYSVVVNPEEFEYIFSNKLYSLDGQIAFSQKLEDNQIDFPAGDPVKGQHGAIELKFSWRELGPNDDRSRFFVQQIKVLLSEPYKPGQSGPETRVFDAGLVGMHIAMRTRSSPEWVWATFEQIDNARSNPKPGGGYSQPSFFNPDAKAPAQTVNCQTGAVTVSLVVPVNTLACPNAVLDPVTGSPKPEPDVTKATTWIESLTTTPVQVVRPVVPTQGALNQYDAQIADSTAALNQQVQKAFAGVGSVFAYYELVGTQWPFHKNAPAVPGGAGSAPESIAHKTPGDMVPVFLVNTSTETFFMKGEQQAGPLEQDDRLGPNAAPIDTTIVTGTESCVGCHYSAGAAIGWKHNPDGSLKLDATGRRIPIFGENSNFGKTGSAHFSWLLQIQAQTAPYKLPPTVDAASSANLTTYLRERRFPSIHSPAAFLHIHRSTPRPMP